MNLRLHIAAIAGAALLIPVAGFAADAATSTAEAPKAAAKEKEAEAKETKKVAAEKPKKVKCETTTGSRLRKSRECTPSASAARSYSQEDLQNMGKTDLSEALRQMDAGVR